MKSRIIWIALGLLALGSVPYLLGRQAVTQTPTIAAPPVVYLDRQTRQLVVAPPRPVDSDTGQPSRVRALYCSRCKRWQAVPPTFPGNPRSFPCPLHHLPMSDNGPISSDPQTPQELR